MTIDITGQRFGRLVALRQAKYDRPKRSKGAMWLCQCDCGNITYASSHDLRTGMRKSCGCAKHNAGGQTGARWRKYGCDYCADFGKCGGKCKHLDELDRYSDYAEYERSAGYAVQT